MSRIIITNDEGMFNSLIKENFISIGECGGIEAAGDFGRARVGMDAHSRKIGAECAFHFPASV